MNIENQNINLFYHISKRFQIHKKIFMFSFGFILFGTLSFISYRPMNNNSPFDNEVVLLNEEDSEKQNDITENNFNNSKQYQHEFALIVGSYKKEYNAKNLESEMKKRGFKDCTIISDKNLNKYWVILKRYASKNQAVIDRERYLLDGWIKQL